MAIGTGALIGFFASRIIIIYSPLFNSFLGASIAVLIYQITAYSKFWGKRRGEFEYQFKVGIIDSKVKKLVFRYLGILKYLSYVSDGMNNISIFQGDLCKRLIDNDRVNMNDGHMYYVYMKMSLLENKNDNLEKEITFLKSALEIKSDDLIANYRLVICFELNKNAEDAIKHYEKALRDIAIDSKEIKDFIKLQINRVNTNGTMNKSPALGLRYMSW